MNLEYILTEDNTMVGIKGFCTDYSGYKNVSYQNRCLFMKISPDHHFKYEVTEQRELHTKLNFKFETDKELLHYAKHSGLGMEEHMLLFVLQSPQNTLKTDRHKVYYSIKRL